MLHHPFDLFYLALGVHRKQLCHLHSATFVDSLFSPHFHMLVLFFFFLQNPVKAAKEKKWPDGWNVKKVVMNYCCCEFFLSLLFCFIFIWNEENESLCDCFNRAYECFHTVSSIMLIKNSICIEESNCCVRANWLRAFSSV